MKKLFTLVALCACLGVYADDTTVDLDLSSLSCGWGNGGSYDASTYTATFGAQWDGCSCWLGQYTDWSDYDALTINWDSSTADAITINLVIQNSDYSATAATDYYDAQSYSTITLTFSDYDSFTSVDSDGATVENGFESISQWWVGSSAAGSVTFTSAYLTIYGDEEDDDDTETGISSIDNDNIVSVEYYSLSGQKLATPSTGVVIKKITDASGNTSVKKVFVKTL